MPEMSDARPPANPVRVAIVDDHPTMRQVLISLLGEHPAIEFVDEGENGEEAVEVVDRSQPDVVLLNYQMPGMHGAEAASEIRRRWPHVKIIGVSAAADGDSEARREMDAGGADRFLAKEAGAERIIATIRELASARER